MSLLLRGGVAAMEHALLPDSAIRWGIRRLLEQRIEECKKGPAEAEFVEMMNRNEVAPVPAQANAQHYELPPEFFVRVLGANRKYSSCYWPEGCQSLDEAETEALRVTCERAGITGGMRILELGCGWGSLSLWMASRFPGAEITAVSNSAPQRWFIEREADRRGIRNLHVITADMNRFEATGRFDRVVTVEMFEHMRNWRELLRRVSGWLAPGGKLFIHIFCHREFSYEFETEGEGNWMGRYFFTGGIMPSENLFSTFQDHLNLVQQWRWDGMHYEKTANAWLANQDARRAEILPILAATYGEGEAEVWFQRWRVFFMSCAELWGFRGGQEWLVGHYLFERP